MKVDLLRFRLESGKWVAFVAVACLMLVVLPLGSQAKKTGGSVFTASPDESISNQCLLWSYRSATLSVSISADGSYIATVSGDGVQLFSRADNTPIWSYRTSVLVDSICISSNGSYIAAGSYDGILGELYLFTGELRVTPDETWLLAIVAIVGFVVLGIGIALKWRRWGR